MSESEHIFGIDLGTTNSAIAWVRDGVAEVIACEGEQLMPSVVGIDAGGGLLVGTAARNQLVVYPERTVASIKRKMGSDERIALGDREFAPEEISAVLLKELARRAHGVTGVAVERVVITVPAFFRDAQRQATRAAGEIAGLEVVGIINEPTAAALAFGGSEAEDGSEGETGRPSRCLLVYDLGGGTFDVSVVRSDGELIEVLASHGDVHLGGDDFDRLIADDFWRALRDQGHVGSREDRKTAARLLATAESAKIRLTEELTTRVREEFLGERDGRGVHLDTEFSRQQFEVLVTPLIEKSLDSVHEALAAAGRSLAEIDDVLLVGGQSRAPIIGARLGELCGKPPRRDVHPDLCVALGAAVRGARLAGDSDVRVLVDVTPYSFGPSHLGELEGYPYPDCYTPVIERGTPLPITRSSSYWTAHDNQQAWDVQIFQGESRDARENILVGRFMAEGFSNAPAGNEILCKMALDLDGILSVEVVERCTGLTKTVTIEGAATAWSDEKIAAARQRTAELWGEQPDFVLPRPAAIVAPGWHKRATVVLARGEALLEAMAQEDRAEFAELADDLRDAIQRQDETAADPLVAELEDLVHYVEEA